MMIELSAGRQRLIALALLLIFMLAAWWFVISPVWTAAQSHVDRVDMLRRQAAALEGLTNAAPRLEAEAKAIEATPDLQLLVFSAEQPSVAVAQLQGQLGQIFAQAPASVTSSEVMAESREGALTKIGLQMAVLSTTRGLVKALHEIAVARPLMKIEKIALRDPDGTFGLTVQGKKEGQLQVDITISAYMRAP
jgi:hypothetical protein